LNPGAGLLENTIIAEGGELDYRARGFARWADAGRRLFGILHLRRASEAGTGRQRRGDPIRRKNSSLATNEAGLSTAYPFTKEAGMAGVGSDRYALGARSLPMIQIRPDAAPGTCLAVR
jgi:hypothetical protein